MIEKLEKLDNLIRLADAHQRADEYDPGHYEWNTRGACSIGCTLHDARSMGLLDESTTNYHEAVADLIGVEPQIAHIQDAIFEGLAKYDRAEASALTPALLRTVRDAHDRGADLSMLWPRVALWLLGDSEHGVYRVVAGEERWGLRDAVSQINDLYVRWCETGLRPMQAEFDTAWAAEAVWAAGSAGAAGAACAWAVWAVWSAGAAGAAGAAEAAEAVWAAEVTGVAGAAWAAEAVWAAEVAGAAGAAFWTELRDHLIALIATA